MPHTSLQHIDHRPWSLPAGPWVAAQSWRQLLFAHWRVDKSLLRPWIPEPLTIDEADGSAWVAVVPFYLVIRPRCLPAIPRIGMFPEINVRTYVSYQDKPGVWFFSLDAHSPLAVWAARKFFHLPYFRADMSLRTSASSIAYRSTRRDTDSALHFTGRYGPTGAEQSASPGSLLHFLTERYCLYAQAPTGALFRTEVHHAPWPLQPAWAEIEKSSMLAPLNMDPSEPPELLHFARSIEVTTWMPERLPDTASPPA